MSQDAIPVPIPCPAYADPIGLHTHPVPLWLRIALPLVILGLIVFGALAVITYEQGQHRDDQEIKRAAQTAADACWQTQTNAMRSVAAYNDLLTKLEPETDPAIREFIGLARDASTRIALTPCPGEDGGKQ